MPAADLRPEIRWLSSGFLLMFCSGFGQAYFIAIFAGYLKADLAITDGQFGSLYTLGTLASATLLPWAGAFADKLSIRWYGGGAASGHGGLLPHSRALAGRPDAASRSPGDGVNA